jgi:Ca2+-binding RTX toxin-like protein
MTTSVTSTAVGRVELDGGSNYTLEATGSITDGSTSALALLNGDCQLSIFGGIYGADGIVEEHTGTGANTLYIGATGIVSGASGDGIELFDDQNFVDNDGSVHGFVDGIELIGDKEAVTNGGHISGSFEGIVIAGSQGLVTNTGTITGGEGVEFGGGTTAATDRVENSGTITANETDPGAADPGTIYSYGVAGENHSGNMAVSNSGTISGDYGVVYEGASGLVDSLDNSGTIESTGDVGGQHFYAILEAGGSVSGGAALAINNSGTISAPQFAIDFSDESLGNTLDNSGTILGSIVSDPTSTLAVTNSGHIAGGIGFGDGDDSYDGTLGSITNTVHGGGGDDSLTGGAGQDHLDGGAGNDTLSGLGGNDVLSAEGTAAAIDGGDGNDVIKMASFLDSSDVIDGGAGKDTLSLDGDYSAGFVFGTNTMVNVETIALTDGFSYRLTTNDTTVAAGATLTVDATALTGTNGLKFTGSAETDGRFVVNGGAGNDIIVGGAGNDVLTSGAGSNRLTGGLGADRMTSEGAHDLFIYTDVAESTSTTHDAITRFSASTDRFELNVVVTGVDAAITSGALSAGAFDAGLSAVTAGHLAAGHAVLFTASNGNLAGHTYLIVDANGVAGYQAGQDYVMEIVGGTHSSHLSTANFIT